jgi:hypothetical protein
MRISKSCSKKVAKRVSLGALLNQNEPEVEAYITGLTTPLSSTQIGKLNTFVRALKTGLGISALSDAFDVMYILAGETAESSLKNLVKNAHHATAVNSPDFTALEGFTGNGTTSYINTNYIPNLHKINFALDYASLGIYIRNNTSGDIVDMGARDAYFINRTYIQSKASTSTSYGNVNQNNGYATSPLLVPTSIGMTIYNRLSSTILNHSKNKTISTNIEYASSGIPSYSVTIGALNTADVISLFTTRQYSFAFMGKGLTNENIITLVNAIEAYMDSNGKGVIA